MLKSFYRGLVLAAVAAGVTLVTFDTAQAARGFQARPCGFDLNANGKYGEPGECDFCDGTTADPDHDGVAEDINYVDCNSGSNTSGCGAPGSPCKTLTWVMNGQNTSYAKRANDSDNEEDIICFKATCSNETPDLPPHQGVGGTPRRRGAMGNEVRAFDYPNNPFMIVGWDADNDGCYWPYDDGHDTAKCGSAEPEPPILDGRGKYRGFSGGEGYNDTEFAHFEARDFNRDSTSAPRGGFVTLEHGAKRAYFHDLSLSGINQDAFYTSYTIVFGMFFGTTYPSSYVSVENVKCTRCDKFMRGGWGDGDEKGPMRMKNVSWLAYGCGEKKSYCTLTSGGMPGSRIAEFWGNATGFEFLDNSFDFNPSEWLPGANSPAGALTMNVCTRDWDVVNNEFIDFRMAVAITPDDGGNNCTVHSRRMDQVRLDRNVFIQTSDSSHYTFGSPMPIEIEGRENTASYETVDNVQITNNFFYSAVPYKGCVWSYAGYDKACSSHGGQILIANNTCVGDIGKASFGAINIGNVGGVTEIACRHDNYVVKNNIISGISGTGTGDRNIAMTYAPKNWSCDNNVYDPEGQYEWNDATTASFSTWKSASHGDSHSKVCTPTFVDRLKADLHLKSGDTCAVDAGAAVSGMAAVDIDGGSRPSGAAWDIGADEFGSGSGGGITPPPPPPPPDDAPPAPVLLEVVPLPD